MTGTKSRRLISDNAVNAGSMVNMRSGEPAPAAAGFQMRNWKELSGNERLNAGTSTTSLATEETAPSEDESEVLDTDSNSSRSSVADHRTAKFPHAAAGFQMKNWRQLL